MVEPIIKSLIVGEFEVGAYLVACPVTRQAALIDPAGDPDELAAWVVEAGVTVSHILATHGHPDHCLGLRDLAARLGAPVAMHAADVDFFASPEGERVCREELRLMADCAADLRLEGGDVLRVGELAIHVIHTPGHTPGSVCYLVGGHLFTGDTLFVGAVGRTDLGGADFQTLLDSIRDQILPLPEATIIHPGHDYGETPFSTLAREKEENPYITDFILEG